MRVVMLHNRYREPGGEDIVVEHEAKLLSERGHELQSLHWSNESIRADGTLRAGVALATAIWNRQAARRVGRLVQQFRPQVVHIHNTLAVASAAVVRAAAVPGIGLVHTLHNFRHVCLNGLLLRDERVCTDCVGKIPWRGVVHACYRGSSSASLGLALSEVTHRALRTWSRVHRFIALSEHVRQLHVKAGIPVSRIALKPQTIVDDPGVGDHRGSFALFAGRLSVEKGLQLLPKLWEDGRFGLPLLIAGEGPESGWLRTQTQGQPHIRTLGRVPRSEVVALMREAQMLILPTLCLEGAHPLTLLEGLATGCPIVASDIGAVSEVIRSGENGILVPPGDPTALARAIEQLHRSPDLRARLSRGARETFEQRFLPERSYEALIRIYREAHQEAQRELNTSSR